MELHIWKSVLNKCSSMNLLYPVLSGLLNYCNDRLHEKLERKLVINRTANVAQYTDTKILYTIPSTASNEERFGQNDNMHSVFFNSSCDGQGLIEWSKLKHGLQSKETHMAFFQ